MDFLFNNNNTLVNNNTKLLRWSIFQNIHYRNETKHVELEQFLHAFTSRGFDSVSWAFLLYLCTLHSVVFLAYFNIVF